MTLDTTILTNEALSHLFLPSTTGYLWLKVVPWWSDPIILGCLFALAVGIELAVWAMWKLRQDHRWVQIQWTTRQLWLGGAIFLIATGVLFAYIGLKFTDRGTLVAAHEESKIIQLLKERIPDVNLAAERHRELISSIARLELSSDLADKRHQELIAAIKSAGSAAAQLHFARFKVRFLGGFFVVLFLGSLIWMIFAPQWYVYIPRLVAAGSFTLLSADALLGVDKLTIFELSEGKGEKVTHVTSGETRISLDLIPKGFDIDCNPKRYLLTDFPIGYHVGGEQISRRAHAIGEYLRKENEGGRLAAVILVGSADKQQLQPSAQRIYDTNAGLAQARARWVQARLEEGYQGTIVPLLVLSTGPSFVGISVQKERLAEDRSVLMCAVWTSKRISESNGR